MRCSNRGKTHLDILVSVFLLSTIVAIVAPRLLRLEADAHRANNEGAAAELGTHIAALHTAAKNGSNKIFAGGCAILLSEDNWPISVVSHGKTLAFAPGEEGDMACRDFFIGVMSDSELRVLTQKEAGDRNSEPHYIAEGSAQGCKFMYQEANLKNGKVYILHYDMASGNVSAKIEVHP